MTSNIKEFEEIIENIHRRRNDIDALRVFATILLIFFHTASLFTMYLVAPIKNQELSLEMLIFVLFIHIWHMPLFFFLAGMSTFYSLNFRTDRQYIKERFKRLIIPFILGVLIIIPPLSYYAHLASWSDLRRYPINFSGSFIEFYPRFFERDFFTWGHLWFLLYLFFISSVSIFTLLKKEARNQGFSSMVEYYGKGRRIFLLALPMILINISLRWLFPGFLNFVTDWANMFFYLSIFIFGFLIVGDIRFEESIDRNKRLALILATILSFIVIFMMMSSFSGTSNPSITG
ncbi:MAG: acyltransferase, partial [Promethearchaeota archaeon]